jgi:glycosyltransferase involved in cell wall biosynthesis
MNPPSVTAIIATYNRAHIVGEAIDSILQQRYKPIELIVVDDGSTDDTLHTLRKYRDQIRVISQPNVGPAAAWNTGIRESQGEIITFLGSDDIWLPEFVERQVRLLRQVGDNIPCSLSNCWLKFGNGKTSTSFENALMDPHSEEGIWLNVSEVLSTRFVVFGQTVAIRRRALSRIGYFDEDLRYLEDYDMALRLSLEGPWGFVREPLVVWRQGTVGSDSLSQEARRDAVQLKRNVIRIHERILNQLGGNGQHRPLSTRLTRELRKDRLNLFTARLTQMNSYGGRSTGKLLNKLDSCWNAAYRRAPWFPKMKTRPFDQSQVTDSSSVAYTHGS